MCERVHVSLSPPCQSIMVGEAGACNGACSHCGEQGNRESSKTRAGLVLYKPLLRLVPSDLLLSVRPPFLKVPQLPKRVPQRAEEQPLRRRRSGDIFQIHTRALAQQSLELSPDAPAVLTADDCARGVPKGILFLQVRRIC